MSAYQVDRTPPAKGLATPPPTAIKFGETDQTNWVNIKKLNTGDGVAVRL